MHTLTTFPYLLNFGFIAPTLLRIGVAIFLLYLTKERYHKKYKGASILYLIAASALLLGYQTQFGAILGIILVKFDYWTEKNGVAFVSEKTFLYGLPVIILLSLLFTGPGFFAFDLPL